MAGLHCGGSRRCTRSSRAPSTHVFASPTPTAVCRTYRATPGRLGVGPDTPQRASPEVGTGRKDSAEDHCQGRDQLTSTLCICLASVNERHPEYGNTKRARHSTSTFIVTYRQSDTAGPCLECCVEPEPETLTLRLALPRLALPRSLTWLATSKLVALSKLSTLGLFAFEDRADLVDPAPQCDLVDPVDLTASRLQGQ